eukprot:scaffold229_cov57-Phaeocystis_antarctica.AAC.2
MKKTSSCPVLASASMNTAWLGAGARARGLGLGLGLGLARARVRVDGLALVRDIQEEHGLLAVLARRARAR